MVLNTILKIRQRNTNRTASHKSTFKIYILYEVKSSLFALSRLCFVPAANDNFTVHKIISSLNDTDLFPVYAHSLT